MPQCGQRAASFIGHYPVCQLNGLHCRHLHSGGTAATACRLIALPKFYVTGDNFCKYVVSNIVIIARTITALNPWKA